MAPSSLGRAPGRTPVYGADSPGAGGAQPRERRRFVFAEVASSPALSDRSLEQRREELNREAEELNRLLLTELEHGETTQAFARHQANLLNTNAGQGGYYAQGSGLKRIKIKAVPRKEIDTDKLSLAFWLMAKRSVEEKRKKQAEATKNQLPLELDRTTDSDEEQWLGLS